MLRLEDAETLHLATQDKNVFLVSNQSAYLEFRMEAPKGSYLPVVHEFGRRLISRYNNSPVLLEACKAMIAALDRGEVENNIAPSIVLQMEQAIKQATK